MILKKKIFLHFIMTKFFVISFFFYYYWITRPKYSWLFHKNLRKLITSNPFLHDFQSFKRHWRAKPKYIDQWNPPRMVRVKRYTRDIIKIKARQKNEKNLIGRMELWTKEKKRGDEKTFQSMTSFLSLFKPIKSA